MPRMLCALLFLCFALMPFQSCANDFSLLKYTYGQREKDGWIFLPGRLVSTKSGGLWAIANSSVSESTGNNKDVSMTLAIEVIGGDILAHVKINNESEISYYVQGLSIPWDVSSSDGTKTSVLCWSSFQIISNNIKLSFLGSICDSGSNLDKSEWYEIEPHKSLAFTTSLNDNYEFLTDKRVYEIVTSRYTLVNDNWFIQRSINDLIFSIFNMDAAKICPVTRKIYYGYRKEDICETYFNDVDGIMFLLYSVGITGENHDNEISIRSEPVTIEIEGSKIKSLYDRNY